MFGDEFFFFAGHEGVEARAIDGAVRRFFWRGHVRLRGLENTQRKGLLATLYARIGISGAIASEAKDYRRGAEDPKKIGEAVTRTARGLRSGRCLMQVLRDFAGGVVAGGAGYAVAGMGAVAAEVKVFHWGGVASPAEQGAHGENLIEGEFAVEGVAAGEAVSGFEVLRREDLHGENFRREVGGVLRERFDHSVAQGDALLRPVAGF